jgi:hypothetical protein
MSQASRVQEYLADGKERTIEEIHEACGTMRLNSRVAELRKKRGLNIVCRTVKVNGHRTYAYQLLGSLEPLASSPLHGGNDGNGAGGSSEDGPESLTERVLLEPGEGQDAALLSSLGEPLGAEDRPVPAPLPGQLELLPLPTRG